MPSQNRQPWWKAWELSNRSTGLKLSRLDVPLQGLPETWILKGARSYMGDFFHTGFVTDRQIEMLSALSNEQRKKQIAYDRFRLHSWPGQELLEKSIFNRLGEKCGVHWYTGQAHQPSVYRAILNETPYPVKAMITSASNPLVSHANTDLVYRALKKT